VREGGVLLMVKPPGPTSHDLVAAVRRLAGGLKVGHLGTLDPAAAGLLVLVCGPVTRLAEFLDAGVKEYRAWVRFGVESRSDDAEGPRGAVAACPQLSASEAAVALASLEGTPLLSPPALSAVKLGGTPAYRRARWGEAVTPAPRPMTFHRLRLISLAEGPFPLAKVEAEVGRGAYLRSLARAWGERLGVPAYVEGLVRTRVGPWRLAQANSWEEVAAAWERGEGVRLLRPWQEAADLLPARPGPPARVGDPAPTDWGEWVRWVGPTGGTVGLGRIREGRFVRVVAVSGR
jgi:tRNA pseudouridine55 synthase